MQWVSAALSIVGSFAMAFLAPGSAASASVTFQLQGTVTEVYDEGYLDGSISIGSPISGFYTFDPNVPDIAPEAGIGRYVTDGPPAHFEMTVGNYRFFSIASMPRLGIGIENDNPSDRYAIGSSDNDAEGSFALGLDLGDFVLMIWELRSTAPGPLSSTALLTTPPNPEDWGFNRLSIEASKNLSSDTPLFRVVGTVTTVVPEPSSALLLSAAVASLVLARRRRS